MIGWMEFDFGILINGDRRFLADVFFRTGLVSRLREEESFLRVFEFFLGMKTSLNTTFVQTY
jgi:hypothetical protein